MARVGAGIAVGLLLALWAHALAFGMAGAGHGWITPFFASFALWLFLPITFAIALPLHPHSPGGHVRLLVLLGLGFLADAALITATFNEGTEYFWKVWGLGFGFPLCWLLIWMSWQIVAFLALLRGEQRADDPA